MPAGPGLMKEVLDILDLAPKEGLTTDELKTLVSWSVSVRAVRYATKELVDSGLVQSHNRRSRRFYFKRDFGAETKSGDDKASTEADAGTG